MFILCGHNGSEWSTFSLDKEFGFFLGRILDFSYFSSDSVASLFTLHSFLPKKVRVQFCVYSI